MDILKSVTALGLMSGLAVGPGAEASYPVKPVRFIVTASPGGNDDFQVDARLGTTTNRGRHD